ncbi:MAG TPA: hypothetical protein VHU84_04535 [Lacipirellulaceae bacterium]|nr:hypothetical protein [Lacipirellulaceae bacterium]
MFTQLKKLLSNDAARNSTHRTDVRPTRAWQFERLEDRSMLSASVGQMPMNDIGYLFETHDHSPPMFVAGMYAPAPMESFGVMHHGATTGDGYFDQPDERYDLQNNIGAAWNGAGTTPAYSSFTEQSKPSVGATPSAFPSGGLLLEQYPNGDKLYAIDTFAGFEFVTIRDPAPTHTDYKANDPTHKANDPTAAVYPNNLVGGLDKPGGPVFVAGRPDGPPAAPPYGEFPPLVNSEFGSTSAATSQLTSREAESSALAATTNILDTAFQSYTSQLLLANVSLTTQPTITKVSNDQATPTGEAIDDFIAISDAPNSDSQSASVDAVARERDAVDAVLRNLQDLGELPSELDNSNATDNVSDGDRHEQSADSAFGAAEQMLADAQGGMVLLRAVGDANESPINLVNVVAAQRDLPTPHVGVQASVGFYQAVDIGIEELTAAERIPAPAPSLESAPQAKPDNRYSKQQNAASSGNAAAVLGASTLAGALLWCVGRGQSEDEKTAEADAEKSLDAGNSM